ncbi:MAG TPA: hypothetical protein ENH43_03605 [Phycisphaerales bacterium]|nr:hypothetical protein [Phycisphaerales bacterium]
MLKQLLKKTVQSILIARLALKSARFPSFDYFRVLMRNIRICKQRRYTPIEAFRLGFFSKHFDTSLIDKFTSRKVLTKIQERLNHPSWAELAKNKAIFYSYCLQAKIRVPQWYVVSTSERLFWDCYNNRMLSCLKSKIEFIKRYLPSKFVIKPIRGAYGVRVVIINKTSKGFKDTEGNFYSASDIVEYLQARYPEGFIIQQRVENHPAIVALTGIDALQTARIISLIDNEKKCRIIHAHFKPITKLRVFIDTHLQGLTGNVEVPIDIEKGTLGAGNQITSTGQGIITISKHPITGKSFQDFKLPVWHEACDMVKEAAYKFLPIRAIGWDVALTPSGPRIIEANIWWDPPNQHMRMDEMLKEMSH